jgi:hypothetical protein
VLPSIYAKVAYDILHEVQKGKRPPQFHLSNTTTGFLPEPFLNEREARKKGSFLCMLGFLVTPAAFSVEGLGRYIPM